MEQVYKNLLTLLLINCECLQQQKKIAENGREISPATVSSRFLHMHNVATEPVSKFIFELKWTAHICLFSQSGMGSFGDDRYI